ncbi:MAG: response regulator [Pseudomonadota bacterium]|nr:response regulator [Pseudomonadota bacterium]
MFDFLTHSPASSFCVAAAVVPHAGAPERRRVLVVDDQEDVAVSMARLMEAMGYAARHAVSGEDALAAARDFHPAVILLDIGLPDVDGLEVARRLRQAHGPGLRLIALTGYGQPEDVRRCREAGCDHHLLKPVDFGVLQALLA